MKIELSFGYRALRWASLFGVASLVLMIWGVIDPNPIALVIAMSAGQALGTLAFVVFVLVVINDLRKARVFSRIAGRPSSAPPPEQ